MMGTMDLVSVPVMGTARTPRPRFDVARLIADMTVRGWNNSDLARAADVSAMTVSRFLRGEAQTAKVAERLARALGYTVRRYLSKAEAVA
jgi:transcriptional regulator with XRE-family HTH domain